MHRRSVPGASAAIYVAMIGGLVAAFAEVVGVGTIAITGVVVFIVGVTSFSLAVWEQTRNSGDSVRESVVRAVKDAALLAWELLP